MSNGKSLKYADIIFPDDKKKKSEEKADAVADGKISLDAAIGAQSKIVRAAQKAVKISMQRVPFNPGDIINAQDNLELQIDTAAKLDDLKSMF